MHRAPHDRPPLGSWPLLYAMVALELLLVIALCRWLTTIHA